MQNVNDQPTDFKHNSIKFTGKVGKEKRRLYSPFSCANKSSQATTTLNNSNFKRSWGAWVAQLEEVINFKSITKIEKAA